MKVYLGNISGIDSALEALLMSKRSWTPEKAYNIHKLVTTCTNRDGSLCKGASKEDLSLFKKRLDTICEIGSKHITLLRYINFDCTVEGLHRGGQDDWDSHAARFNNRIVRSSTRLARFGTEKSDYYKDKILTTDEVANELGITFPETVQLNGKTYVKVCNGYVDEEYRNDNDTLRGLYMLSIPSNFVFSCNITEFAHVYKMRNGDSTAHPEVRQLCEMILEELNKRHEQFNRDLMMKIEN